jgi:magnesium transporter
MKRTLDASERARRIGASPGTLLSPPGAHHPVLRAMSWGPEGEIREVEDLTIPELKELVERFPVTWIDVRGLGHVPLLEELGEAFSLHRLALEDTLNVPQRAKLEEYGDLVYVVARMPRPDDETEQVSFYLGDRWVLTVQEEPELDCFDPLRERIRTGRPRLRAGGPDYLLYALLDTLVDAWAPLVERLRERIDDLEDEILEGESHETARRIQVLKREVGTRRRELWPMRDVFTHMLRDDFGLDEDKVPFVRDAADHVHQLIDLIDSCAEAATGLVDMHLSFVSHRMNEIMRVLTIIATIFIPLSFVAGLYGMNFDPSVSRWNMPELGWRYGYPAALAVMAVAAGGMMTWFWRRGWFK